MRSPAAPADTRFTYDDFVLFPDDGKRHEIINGEHYVTLSPEGKLARVVELTAEDGDALTTPLLPGCEIDLRELFRALP